MRDRSCAFQDEVRTDRMPAGCRPPASAFYFSAERARNHERPQPLHGAAAVRVFPYPIRCPIPVGVSPQLPDCGAARRHRPIPASGILACRRPLPGGFGVFLHGDRYFRHEEHQIRPQRNPLASHHGHLLRAFDLYIHCLHIVPAPETLLRKTERNSGRRNKLSIEREQLFVLK